MILESLNQIAIKELKKAGIYLLFVDYHENISNHVLWLREIFLSLFWWLKVTFFLVGNSPINFIEEQKWKHILTIKIKSNLKYNSSLFHFFFFFFELWNENMITLN